MARNDIQELGQLLRENSFGFLPRGTHELSGIYEAVKEKFPMHCDDTYACQDNCSNGHNHPEWKHEVRRSLDSLRRRKAGVRHSKRKGHWEFEED